MKIILFILTITITFISSADSINVGYISNSPYAIFNDRSRQVCGSDVDILRSAYPNDTLLFYRYDNSNDMISKFEADGLDYGIGGVSMTESRIGDCIYTIPTDVNEIRYIYDSKMSNFNIKFKLWATVILKAFGSILITLTVLAHLIWFAEGFDDDDDNFSRNYICGIGQSYYFAFMVATTVGLGDIAAQTRCGRLVTMIIMLVGIMWFGSFLSALNDNMTTLNEYKDFKIERDFSNIGTPIDSSSDTVLDEMGILSITVDNATQGFELLKAGKLSCLVYDKGCLEYVIKDDHKFIMGNEVLKSEYLGILCSTYDNKSLLDSEIVKNY